MTTNTIAMSERQFFSINELLDSGLSYYKIAKLVKAGKLVKLNNKMYENISYEGETSDFAIARVYAPKGMVCMMSAARYYGLTTYLPDGVDMAIGRDMKISTLPKWPQINVWYFPEKRYRAGITTQSDNACEFPIYDIEKTVVDILYYRNRVGIEETRDVLKSFLARENRDLIKLHRYAESLGCRKILETYMEVLQ